MGKEFLQLKKTITVFGSSLPREGDSEYNDAYRLGYLFGQYGYALCTGGNKGIMEAVSKGARDAGSEAIGITVKMFNDHNSYLSERIECDTLLGRIEKLISTGDAYVVLRGGTGTLLEMAVIWEFMNKGLMETKPAVCHSPFWEPLVTTMEEQIAREGRTASLIPCFHTIEQCVTFIHNKLVE